MPLNPSASRKINAKRKMKKRREIIRKLQHHTSNNKFQPFCVVSLYYSKTQEDDNRNCKRAIQLKKARSRKNQQRWYHSNLRKILKADGQTDSYNSLTYWHNMRQCASVPQHHKKKEENKHTQSERERERKRKREIINGKDEEQASNN